MPVSELKCELSWSASRAREFERCKREYWYARYASWNWWSERPPGERYEVMVHKNLTTLPALAGDCVHRAIARWFQLKRSGAAMTASELFEEARDFFREGWRQSNGDGWKRRPNKSVHLDEHHYGLKVPRDRTDEVRDKMERCARNFLEMGDLAAVRDSEPDSWLAVEDLDTYTFLGTKVYAVPDFACEADGRVHVYDWKTGRPSEQDRFQLHTYALYACEKWQADPEGIVLHAVYLDPGTIESYPVDIEALSSVQDRMSESVRAMQELHYDPDQDEVVRAHWVADGAPQRCGRCRFRGICEAAPVSG